MPDVKERIAAVAGEARGLTPDAFAAFLRSQNQRMGKLVKDADIKDQ